jgi:hypothetical protein
LKASSPFPQFPVDEPFRTSLADHSAGPLTEGSVGISLYLPARGCTGWQDRLHAATAPSWPHRRWLAAPQVVGRTAGAWPHRKWLQIINPNPRTIKIRNSFPVSGRDEPGPYPQKKGTPSPPGVLFSFCSLLWRGECTYLSSFLLFANLQASRTFDRAHLELFHKPNGINADVGPCEANYQTLPPKSGLFRREIGRIPASPGPRQRILRQPRSRGIGKSLIAKPESRYPESKGFKSTRQ